MESACRADPRPVRSETWPSIPPFWTTSQPLPADDALRCPRRDPGEPSSDSEPDITPSIFRTIRRCGSTWITTIGPTSPVRLLPALALAACSSATDGIVPYADYHVHLLGPYAAPAARFTAPVTAERLIADLDEAGIQHALVLSEAFWIGGPGGGKVRRLAPAKDQATAARLENDWTAREVARYPGRLVMACGINPLDAWALAELERCSGIPVVRALKLNVSDGGDDIDLHDSAQVRALREFFAAANAQRMPIVIHLGSRGGFGRAEVRTFLREVMSAAPDIPVQIAHMSSGFQSPDALSEFADARAANDPIARNLYFDLSAGRFKDIDPATGRFIVDAIHKIGLEHVLYASDEQPGDQHVRTDVHWRENGEELPLTPEELRGIADNVAPYMR